jgi:hypothetical protein
MEMEMKKTIKPRLFEREVVGVNAALVVQFLLGMYLNMYVEFPKNGPAAAWAFARSSFAVMTHIILGTLLLVGGIALLVRAIRAKNRHWTIVASIAVFGMLMSWSGGERFITTQNDVASYFMAVGFLISLLGFNWGLYTAG